jgi:hypothetical protein
MQYSSPQVLEKLVNDENYYVRSLFAKHRNISLQVLEKLANDKDSLVRLEVAKHSNTN